MEGERSICKLKQTILAMKASAPLESVDVVKGRQKTQTKSFILISILEKNKIQHKIYSIVIVINISTQTYIKSIAFPWYFLVLIKSKDEFAQR